MKKILLALLAVTMVLPVSAMAGTTLYGQFTYSAASVEDNVTDGTVLDDNTPLLGVKGSYGDDVKAFFNLQTEANADASEAFSQRFFFGGLKSDVAGTLKFGRMSNAYKMVGFKMDPFYNTAHVGVNGLYQNKLASYGLSGGNNKFTDNALEYTSPKIADSITVNVGYYNDDANDENGTGAGITYSANGVTAGIQTLQNSDTDSVVAGPSVDSDAIRAHVGYKGEGFSIALSAEEVEETITTGFGTFEMEPTYIFLAGTFDVTDKTQLRATVGVVDDESMYEGTGVTVAAYHALTTNTKVFAQYSMADLDDPAGIFTTEDSPTVIAIGAQIKFSISDK